MRAPASVLLALATLVTTACASNEPVMLTSGFTPIGRPAWASTLRDRPPATVCRISIGEVVDARGDTQSMGRFGGRYVRHDDTVGWVRSAVQSLERDKRLQFASALDADAGVVMHVSLVKAYMEGLATSKNATVVLKVRFVRGEQALGENTYRGDQTDVNWGSGDGEARDSLNIAMQEAIGVLDTDLLARCQTPPPPPAPPESTPAPVAQ